MSPPRNLPSAALAAMWEHDIAIGVDPTGDLLNRPAPSRVIQHEPIVRPTPPAPDWTGEQMVVSLRRDAATPEPEELAPPTTEALQSRPARRRRRHWERPR